MEKENTIYNDRKYICAKCDNTEYKQGEFRAAGGFWSKIFDIQKERFITITCTHCSYTEIFKRKAGKGENILDFFTN